MARHGPATAGPVFSHNRQGAGQMTTAQQQQIRRIVDSIGWSGLRVQYPLLWAEIQRERKSNRAVCEQMHRGF
jgi:hypothetical protein